MYYIVRGDSLNRPQCGTKRTHIGFRSYCNVHPNLKRELVVLAYDTADLNVLADPSLCNMKRIYNSVPGVHDT